jgi:hypothetical protein
MPDAMILRPSIILVLRSVLQSIRRFNLVWGRYRRCITPTRVPAVQRRFHRVCCSGGAGATSGGSYEPGPDFSFQLSLMAGKMLHDPRRSGAEYPAIALFK